MLAISMEVTDAGPVLVAAGEFDLTAVDEFCELAESFLTAGATVTVDLTAVTFIDAAGLSALVSVSDAAARAGTTLRLRRVRRHVVTLLDLTGLSGLLGGDQGALGGGRGGADPECCC